MTRLVLAALLLQDPSSIGLAAEGPCVPIDFETVPGGTSIEGLTIDDQFAASHGIRFRLENKGAPRLAAVGGPITAFEGPRRQPDTPAPRQDIGSFFLTDDATIAELNVSPLVVVYDPPTAAASGVVLDIDFDETFTIEARDAAGVILQAFTIKAGDRGTGDGIATRWAINRASSDIHSIRFAGRRTTAGGFGLGFDNFCSRSSAAGSLLQISLDAAVLFDFDKSALRPEAEKVLTSAVERIAAYPRARVIVEGHTDNVGSASYNQRLSEERAASVVKFLQSRLSGGPDTIAFESVGYGDTRPASENGTEQGRRRNRRVEIRVTPLPGFP
jgi:outer membrane protein OmpA-like peptidoglycan-associated protein